MKLNSITNVAQVPQRSLFRFPGGKTWLVPIARRWLRYYSPVQLLVEPFAGGGAVGLTAAAEELATHVLLVELDAAVASVWDTVLDGHAQWLCHRIHRFKFLHMNVKRLLSLNPPTQHERAFQTIVHNRASRSGIMAPGAGLIKSGENGKGIGSRWYPKTLQARVRAIHGLCSAITFIHGDGLATINDHIHEKGTALFIDPPYTIAGRRLYRHNEIDHERLFSLARRHVGPFLMTYDDTLEVRRWVRQYGFHFRRVAMQSAHLAKKNELLISSDLRWLP